MKLQLPEAFQSLFATTADDGGPVRYRMTYGGRGSAKSHSKATALLAKARSNRLMILCCREIQHSIRDSIKRLLDNKIKQYGWGVAGDNSFASLDSEIRGANGSLIVFAGLRSNYDSIASMEGIDIAYITEARAVSQASLEVLTPTVRAPNSEIWGDWNPRDPSDPIDLMFRGPAGPPPRTILRRVNYYDNPWFPEVLKEDMEWDKRRDPDKYAHIWLGEYRKNSEARVFKNWRIGTYDEFNTSLKTVFNFGADFGFSIDPSTLIRCYIDPQSPRTLYVDKELYKVGVEIDHIPFWYNQVMNDQITPGGKKWTIVADSSRPETISYLRRHEFHMLPSRKGAGSVEDGIEFLKSYDIVVHPECVHTIDELTLCSYQIDKKTALVLPLLEDRHNHIIDALRYAVEPLRRGLVIPFARPLIIAGTRRAPGAY